MKKTTLFSKAFEYAVHGYSVMPLMIDKKPLLKSWKEYQTKAATEEKITDWWQKKPTANIGIITGKVSGITVVDIDDPSATPLSKFPRTFTVKTPTGGYHLYYKYAEGYSVSANAYADMPHVDIRGDGGFVVAPPSHCEYTKGSKKISGDYTIEVDAPVADFPIKLFPAKKEKRKMGELVGVAQGGRNDSMAAFMGKLLRSSPEKEWESEVWPAAQRANKTYSPPLDDTELRTTYDSIVGKEKERLAGLVVSTYQVAGEDVKIPLRKGSNGQPYKDMANALAVLQYHPFYKGTLRYNRFRQEIEYNGQTLEDEHLVKMQYFMQSNMGLSSMSKDTVLAAVQYAAGEDSYDEVQDWIKGLTWDGTPRLATWIAKATGVEDDEYHAGIGSQWFMGLISRIMQPGSVFDYVLVMVGPQGIGKTSLFRIIGGPWYKNYTGAMDNKDFYLALRGALIIDLDEGASLSRSDSIKIKSIITNTHDEYRAPYERLVKKYPRRFVFSMSTNDTEPFRDVTGNRRYWTVDADSQVDFKFLEENREQLFAEAYHNWFNKVAGAQVPMLTAVAKQEEHLPEDAWTDLVRTEVQKSMDYCAGNEDYFTTAIDIYSGMFGADKLDRFSVKEAMRLASVFKAMGLYKVRESVNGERKWRWRLTPKKAAALKAHNAEPSDDPQKEFERL